MHTHMHMHSTLRTPDWSPLERALNAELGASAREMTSAFLFVGFVSGPDDVGELRVYQHSVTRRQLTLDVDGRAYRYFAEMNGYGSSESGSALLTALAGRD